MPERFFIQKIARVGEEVLVTSTSGDQLLFTGLIIKDFCARSPAYGEPGDTTVTKVERVGADIAIHTPRLTVLVTDAAWSRLKSVICARASSFLPHSVQCESCSQRRTNDARRPMEGNL